MNRTTSRIISGFLITMLLSASGCAKATDEPSYPISEALRSEKASEPPSAAAAPTSAPAAETPIATPFFDPATQSVDPAGEPEPNPSPTAADNPALSRFEPIEFQPAVAEYQVFSDLSNVKNISDFDFLSESQRELLAKNHFVVTPDNMRRLYNVYESNNYDNIPNFISVDSVLHTYSVLNNHIVRFTEAKRFLPQLERLTGEMLRLTIDAVGVSNDPVIKDRFIHVLAYFCVAEMLLGNMPPHGIPDEALEMANTEYNLIKAYGDGAESPVTGRQVRYSMFKPVGHYGATEDLRRYYELMTLYSMVGLPFFDEQGEFLTYQTIDALIISNLAFSNPETRRLWQECFEAVSFLSGQAGDVTPEKLYGILIEVYGNNPSPDSFSNTAALDLMRRKLSGLRFSYMGRPYIPDSEILSGLSEPALRPQPKGLDVFAVLGLERAGTHLQRYYRPAAIWTGYTEAFAVLKNKFQATYANAGSGWPSIYYGWFWTLQALGNGFGEGYPMFMRSEAWQDKSLMSALGSWTEMRRDTIPSGRPAPEDSKTLSERRDDIPGHYVEPRVDVYERLLWLTKSSRENLSQLGMWDGELDEKMKNFENMLGFMIDCSLKELSGEPLSGETMSILAGYGDALREMALSYAEQDAGDMAIITYVNATPATYLVEAVGYASVIYVIVPVDGELYLTKGAVFDYYEFESPTRLSDGDWQNILAAGGTPERPRWTDSFIRE